jgi:SAM-dependent methyltransferase
MRCAGCHGVYQRPTLVPESNLYTEFSEDEYFRLHESEQKVRAGESLAAFAESVLGRRGAMLELGCGRGELLRGAANRGWTVRGIEMTEGYSRVAREKYGIVVESAPVKGADSLRDSHDVILLAAILEHLYDPAETLQLVRDALRPGGLVFIDVPNECSLMTRVGNAYVRLQGRNWAVNLSPTFPPFHVVGFCPVSLRHLLDRIGLEVLSLELHRWNNALPMAKDFRSSLERRGLDAVLSLGKMVGMGAGITCWAIRR